MSEFFGQLRDIVHAQDGSMLSRRVQNDGTTLEQLADELFAPEMDNQLATRGYSETRETLLPLSLKYAAELSSATYRSLLEKPYTTAHIQTTSDVDPFGRKLNHFSVILRDEHIDGCAEIASDTMPDGTIGYFIQHLGRDIQNSEVQPIDQTALVVILKDLLSQVDYDTRMLKSETPPSDLLGLLVAQSQKVEVTKTALYSQDETTESGQRFEVDFKKIITLDSRETLNRKKRPEKKVTVEVSSIQLLGTTALQENQPFAVTKLIFEADDNKHPKGVLQAGLGRLNPTTYSLEGREQLLEGTFRQHGQVGIFSEKILQGLAWAASYDTSEFLA